MHWGDAGYSCRSARLTEAEADALYAFSVRKTDHQASNAARDPFLISDPTPRTGTFAQPKNAMRFFAANCDPDLSRWARILFRTIRTSEA